MRAVVCRALGPPETLRLEEIADPEPGPDEVLVRIRATGLNFYDTLIIQGRYQVKPELPFSPGGEFCGVVDALGPGVTDVTEGTRIIAYPGWGGCAEKITVKAASVVPVPDGVTDDSAAGLLVTYGTSLHALKDRAGLKPGETLAVLGAAGGVGLAAVEIGKAMGARVIACASSDDKLALAADRGADEGINYETDDLKTALKAAGGGRGVDVVYDPVGGDFTEAALRALAWNGRLLVIGFASGEIPKLPLNLTLVKGCSAIGVFWGRFMEEEPEAHRANTTQLLDWCADGTLKPFIDSHWPLEETIKGLERLAARKARGKVIVTP